MSDFNNMDFGTGGDNLPKQGEKKNNPSVIDIAESASNNNISDPNAIIVEITNNSPIVVLWGPRTCGKSVAMIRLTRYLKQNQYKVNPLRSFRPDDNDYLLKCDNFNNLVLSPVAPEGTGVINFLLLEVEKNGKKICQILEAPGEHYFEPTKPNHPLPTYLAHIVNNSLPKIYVFFLEINWKKEIDRDNYANNIARLLSNVRDKDSVILLCNKSDVKKEYIYKGKPEIKKYLEDIRNQYKAIFESLGNKRGIFKMFLPQTRDFQFVVFSSGDFPDRVDGGQTFVESNDIYPNMLWDAVSKSISGRWF